MIRSRYILLCATFILWADHTFSQKITIDRNKSERLEWYHNLAFGMMISWSVDSQLGGSMSHNVAASSKEYQDFYFNELPKTFNPKDFDPEKLAHTAKLAGVKYMVFTAKHHSGFCMWDTKTSDFNIMNSAYGKDLLKEIIEAFRKRNIAIGLSFSPDDFYVMYQQGHHTSRETPESSSTVNTGLWEINKKQLSELLTNYGQIDMLYIDENSEWANPLVANYAWDLDPDLVITKGGMETYRNYIPDNPIEAIWESVISIISDWQDDDETGYKSSDKLVDMLIGTRAKGGNFVLEIQPNPSGNLNDQQETRLRQIGLWNAANHEAIYDVKPVKGSLKQNIRLTQSNDEKYIYAFVNAPYWDWMDERAFFIRNLHSTENTMVNVLGQSQETMEYQVHRSPKTIFSNTDEGIFVNVVKAQLLQKAWKKQLVVRFEGVEFMD